MSQVETVQEAKDRIGDIVKYLPTGKVTDVRGWETDENGGALAVVSMGEGFQALPSTEFVELGYDDALDILRR